MSVVLIIFIHLGFISFMRNGREEYFKKTDEALLWISEKRGKKYVIQFNAISLYNLKNQCIEYIVSGYKDD